MKKNDPNEVFHSQQQDASTKTNLYYSFPTQPGPIQSSPQNGSSGAYLNIVASAQGKTVYCKEIDIYLPVGSGEGYLTANAPVITPNTSKWIVAKQSAIDFSRVPRDLDVSNPNLVQYICKAVGANDYQIDYDLQFSIDVQGVDSTPGDFVVNVVEYSNTDGSSTYPQTYESQTLLKSPPVFYLDNFIASLAGSGSNPNLPAAEFTAGESLILSWQGNGSSYKIFTVGSGTPIYSGADTSFTITGGISQDTSYVLQAEVVGGPDSGTPAAGYESVFLYESLTIKCSNPALTPATIVSTGDITTQSDLHVSSTANIGTLSVTGGSTVTGTANFGNVSVGGTLGVTGQSTLSGLNVSGLASVSGGFEAKVGPLTMITSPVLLQSSSVLYSASFTAKTDGVVMGYCESPADYNATCVYWFYIVSNNFKSGSKGGGDSGLSKPSTISQPIQNGETFTLYITPWLNNTTTTTVVFKFFPYGNNGSLDTLVQLDEIPWNHKLKVEPSGKERG